MNGFQIKVSDSESSLNRSTPNMQQASNKNNKDLVVLGNKAISGNVESSNDKQSNIRTRILSVSHSMQDAKNIMQNAQIRMLMEEYDIKFNPKNKKIRANMNIPYLSRSQSSMISSIGATLNSQSMQGLIDSKAEDYIIKRSETEGNTDDNQELVTNQEVNQNHQEERQKDATHLPSISQKLIKRMSEQVGKFNKDIQQQAKEVLYQAQKAFTQSTMPTETSYQKQKLLEISSRQQAKAKNTFGGDLYPLRSVSEKKLRASQDFIGNDKLILERDSLSNSQQIDATTNFITSPSEYKKSTNRRKQLQKPKSLVFIQNLSEYAQQKWTETLYERIKNLDYQNAGKEMTARGQQLIELFESFILNEIRQCDAEDITMANSLVLNEVCKLLEDSSLYCDTLLKKVKDNRNEKEESEVIELFGYCMKFNNPEHSDEFIEELKSFFERKYQTLINKLRIQGNTSTQIFIDTLQNVEIFFKLYKDKLSLTRQKAESLKQELEDAHRLIAELEARAKNSHLVQERTEIQYKMKNREDVLDVQNRYERLYNERIEENKIFNKKLEQDIEVLREQLKLKDGIIEKQKMELDNYDKTLNKKKVDASTQISIHIMPYVQNQTQNVTPVQQLPQLNPSTLPASNPFVGFANDFMSPFTFSKGCSGAFVSLILSECMFNDYSLYHRHKFCSYSPSHNYNHLVNFSHQFFVTKFGNKIIGEIFLKNFVQSLQEYSAFGILRFTIFCQLTGLEIYQGQNQRKNSPKNNLNRSTMSANSLSSSQNSQISFPQFVKKMFWESKQSYIIYMRVAMLFRKSLLKNSNSQQHSMYGIYSLFDNTELLNKQGQTEGYENASILISRAQPIIQDIISDHLPKPEVILEVFKSFQNYISQLNIKDKQNGSTFTDVVIEDEKKDINMSPTLKNAKNKNRNASPIKQNILNKRVTMDQIAMFILDYLSELKSLQLERFMTSLKLVQNQKKNSNIAFKDFTDSFTKHYAFSPFISTSPAFQESLFSKFIMNSTTVLNGGDEQRKTALKSFLQALFDDFNEFENENLNFYLTSEYLSQQSSLNMDKILQPLKQQQSTSRILTSQHSRFNRSQDAKRSNSQNKKQIEQQNMNPQFNTAPQLTAEQQIIQILQEEIFDVPNSIVIIYESYEQLKPLIKSEEALDDRIKLDHEKFRQILPQLNKIKNELKLSSENNPTVSAQPRKSYIETVKYVQQTLNSVILYATSKLKLPVNF